MTKEDKLDFWLSLSEEAKEQLTANKDNFILLIKRFDLKVDRSEENKPIKRTKKYQKR